MSVIIYKSYFVGHVYCWVKQNLFGLQKAKKNLKNLSRSIERHKSSKDHVHNHFNLKNLENNTVTIIDTLKEHGKLFKKNYNENVRLNRLFMEHLIDIVLYLSKQELAFRGHDESNSSLNKGNYKELFEMLFSRCSLEIQNQISNSF